jgi:hypothetical protein
MAVEDTAKTSRAPKQVPVVRHINFVASAIDATRDVAGTDLTAIFAPLLETLPFDPRKTF